MCLSKDNMTGWPPLQVYSATNLIFIILTGDIETNPGARFQCGLCRKSFKESDRVVECDDWGKRFHALCPKLGKNDLFRSWIGGSSYCTHCKADCGLGGGPVLNGHKAVPCDCIKCGYKTSALALLGSVWNFRQIKCAWPKCEFSNFSDSFFGDQLNSENQKRFQKMGRKAHLIHFTLIKST